MYPIKIKKRGLVRLAQLAAFSVVASSCWASPAAAQTPPTHCQFVLGFQTLHSLDPADIGDCVDNQAFAPNGDAQQHTTMGLMAWRKADNWTAFTNGARTWINGPYGLQWRANTVRFCFEADAPSTACAGQPSKTQVNLPSNEPAAPSAASTPAAVGPTAVDDPAKHFLDYRGNSPFDCKTWERLNLAGGYGHGHSYVPGPIEVCYYGDPNFPYQALLWKGAVQVGKLDTAHRDGNGVIVGFYNLSDAGQKMIVDY